MNHGLGPFSARVLLEKSYGAAFPKPRRSVSRKSKHGKKENARQNQYLFHAAKPDDEDECAEADGSEAQFQPALQLIPTRSFAHMLNELRVVGISVPTRGRPADRATLGGRLIGVHALGTKTGIGKASLRTFVSFAASRANVIRCADALSMKDSKALRTPRCLRGEHDILLADTTLITSQLHDRT